MLKRMEEFHGFTILQFCGRGGFGEVYLVQDITGRKLALKVISRQRNPENFEQEFSGLCNYRRVIENHPHLLQIFHVAQDDSCLYYSMEAADSLEADSYRPFTLQNRIADGGYLSVADTDRLARGIREALEVLHAHGMAHRDVKPGNILYVNGVPKLGDIGLVSSHDAVAGRVGTPGFLPPGLRSRFLEGSLTLEESQYCDFYALGKVIYCAFTGLPPDAYPELPSTLPLEEDQAEYARLNRLVRVYCRYMPPPPDNRWSGAVRNFIDEIRRLAAWIGFRRPYQMESGQCRGIVGGSVRNFRSGITENEARLSMVSLLVRATGQPPSGGGFSRSAQLGGAVLFPGQHEIQQLARVDHHWCDSVPESPGNPAAELV